jgi:RNA polymerase sigma factor (TIGR02999 family)
MTDENDITRILRAIEDGDPRAAEQLLPLVYEGLRKLAAMKLARENPGQTLQATALVHEAYLRLAGEGAGGWENRRLFFAAAAEAMRRILVEKARRKGESATAAGSIGSILRKAARSWSRQTKTSWRSTRH